MGRVYMIVLGVLMTGGLSGCGYNDLQGLDEDTKAEWSISTSGELTSFPILWRR